MRCVSRGFTWDEDDTHGLETKHRGGRDRSGKHGRDLRNPAPDDFVLLMVFYNSGVGRARSGGLRRYGRDSENVSCRGCCKTPNSRRPAAFVCRDRCHVSALGVPELGVLEDGMLGVEAIALAILSNIGGDQRSAGNVNDGPNNSV